MIDKTTLECFRGDTKSWTFVLARDGVTIDLTAAKVWMTALRAPGGSFVFQRTSNEGEGITIDADQVHNKGKVVVKLANESTASLPSEQVTLYFDVQVRTSDGDISTDVYGDLIVTPDATPDVS